MCFVAVVMYNFLLQFARKESTLPDNKPIDILQKTCYQQADIRMRSHGLRLLVDDKSVASCQQTCCKLIVKTCYPQPWYRLFQQVETSLWTTGCNKPDFNRPVATWWNWQNHCNLLTSCNKPVKLTTCNKSVTFLAVYFVIFISSWVFSLLQKIQIVQLF